jgi:flagellar hook-associated protein 3 FlgL
MSLISLGDIAQSFMLRQQNFQVRQQVNRLAEEMTTGQTADLARHLSGDLSYLSDIERSLGLLKGYRTSVAEAAVLTSAMQTSLEAIQTSSAMLSQTVLEISSSQALKISPLGAGATTQTFSQIVSALNTQTVGRSLFAGNATDQPALAPAEQILAKLQSAIAGQASASDIRATVETWFDDPLGGFETQIYLGSPIGLAAYRLDRHGSAELDLRANSPAIKEILKHSALMVLATDMSLALDDSERADMLRQAAAGLRGAQDSLTTLRADLGFAEARIEEGRVRLSSEKTSLELARNVLLAVDPFETATQLQTAQSQLESLYAVTVRMSRLSLAEFMR